MIHGQTGTPIPKREIELKSQGSSPVITYRMSPEEIAAKYGPPGTRATKTVKKEETQVSDISTERKIPTKEEFLRMRTEGLTVREIENHFGMAANTLYYRIKKWGLSGINQDQAKLLLDEMMIDNWEPARRVAESVKHEPQEAADENAKTRNDPIEPVERLDQPPNITIEEPVDVHPLPVLATSRRTIRITAAGNQADIENELLAILEYVKAMHGKAFRLEIYLGEFAR